MKRPWKVLLGVAAGLAGVLVLAATVLTFVIDVDTLRPTLESRISQILGRRVTLGRLSLSLWGGLGAKADGIEVGEPMGASTGPVPTLTAGHLRVGLGLIPILRSQVQVRSLRLRDGTVRLAGRILAKELHFEAALNRSDTAMLGSTGRVRAVAEALPGAPRGEASFDVSLVEDRLVLQTLRLKLGEGSLDAAGEALGIRSGTPRLALRGDASLGTTKATGTISAALREGRPEVSFQLASPSVDFDELAAFAGFRAARAEVAAFSWALAPATWAAPPASSSLRDSWLAELTGEGTLEARQGRFAGLDLSSVSTRLTYKRGSLRLEEASFDLYGGMHRGSLLVHVLDPELPLTLNDRLEDVSVGDLLSALDSERAGVLEGTAVLVLEVRGRAPGGRLDRDSLSGTAQLEIRRGRLASVGLLKQVARVLEIAGGRGIGQDETPFERISATFAVSGGTARTRDLLFHSPDLDLAGGGMVGLDGSLSLDVIASFSKDVSESLVRQTPKLGFRVDRDGRLTFPLQIRGGLTAPQVQLDLERVLEEGLEQVIQDRKKSFLRRLLEGRR